MSISAMRSIFAPTPSPGEVPPCLIADAIRSALFVAAAGVVFFPPGVVANLSGFSGIRGHFGDCRLEMRTGSDAVGQAADLRDAGRLRSARPCASCISAFHGSRLGIACATVRDEAGALGQVAFCCLLAERDVSGSSGSVPPSPVASGCRSGKRSKGKMAKRFVWPGDARHCRRLPGHPQVSRRRRGRRRSRVVEASGYGSSTDGSPRMP